MTLDEILKNARLVEGNTCIDQNGDLLYFVPAKKAVLHEDIVCPRVEGFDIIGKTNDLLGFHDVYKTYSGQYIAQLGASYFLIDSDGKLLSEGGHILIKDPQAEEDRIITGYGANCHVVVGKNPKPSKSIMEASIMGVGPFYRPAPFAPIYAVKKPNSTNR